MTRACAQCIQRERLARMDDVAAKDRALVRLLDHSLGDALHEIGADLSAIKGWMARLDKRLDDLAPPHRRRG